MQRFLRTQQLLGEDVFARIQQSRVTVIGLGAVGGYAVEGLARAGVGWLRLVDFDTIELSNINRQILALESTLGQPKAEVAQARVQEINPDCHVEARQVFADELELVTLLDPVPDIIVDAIDSLNPKVQLLHTAYQHQIPIVSSMGAALRTDATKVEVGDIAQSRGCPLAKRVRKRLRRIGIESGIRCVYSTEKVTFSYGAPEVPQESQPGFTHRGRPRVVLGSLPTLTGIFGLMVANEVLLQLTNMAGPR
ncbi:MAG: tRNA threonylcarbamoyladenosine dehydratase [Desulfobulbus propionicus]|nr:MAG: tRNA threonylcarbamoyladenosine dehydratase [Desulfobulbus propionicus]